MYPLVYLAKVFCLNPLHKYVETRTSLYVGLSRLTKLIADMCRKRFRDAKSQGLKGGDGWGGGRRVWMAEKVVRLVDGPIVIGELQNTRWAWKCTDTFVHLSGMWSRRGKKSGTVGLVPKRKRQRIGPRRPKWSNANSMSVMLLCKMLPMIAYGGASGGNAFVATVCPKQRA